MPLEARNLYFRYSKKEPWILENCNITVERGECLAIFATSGHGKTTLGRILAGYLKPSEGEVLLDGMSLPEKGMCPVQLISQHPEKAINPRWRMKQVLEEAISPRWKEKQVLEETINPRWRMKQVLEEAINPLRKEKHVLEEAINPLRKEKHVLEESMNPRWKEKHIREEGLRFWWQEQGLLKEAINPRWQGQGVSMETRQWLRKECEAFGIESAWLERFPRELSGGELQRFCVARALLSRPDYLICDEISTMLDGITQAQIWNTILQKARQYNMGVVVFTHNVHLAEKIATRRIHMDSLTGIW